MDSAVKNDDRFSAIRAAIEMGKNFDIAFGYENALINGNYATVIDGR
jgi:malate synthase